MLKDVGGCLNIAISSISQGNEGCLNRGGVLGRNKKGLQ